MLPKRLSDYRAVGLAIGSNPTECHITHLFCIDPSVTENRLTDEVQNQHSGLSLYEGKLYIVD